MSTNPLNPFTFKGRIRRTTYWVYIATAAFQNGQSGDNEYGPNPKGE